MSASYALIIVVVHTAIAFTAAKWWLKPVLLAFDKRMNLGPCKESDFFFFCWSWSVILLVMALYLVWDEIHRALTWASHRLSGYLEQRRGGREIPKYFDKKHEIA